VHYRFTARRAGGVTDEQVKFHRRFGVTNHGCIFKDGDVLRHEGRHVRRASPELEALNFSLALSSCRLLLVGAPSAALFLRNGLGALDTFCGCSLSAGRQRDSDLNSVGMRVTDCGFSEPYPRYLI
jgi:hypothetical protein